MSTDTFGFPFCIDGKAAHDEMGLMQASGLSNFQILKGATSNPAKFLRREKKFGTLAVGQRADDLLLVRDNPLQNLETTRRPVGVMVRGIWLPQAKLDQTVTLLASHK